MVNVPERLMPVIMMMAAGLCECVRACVCMCVHARVCVSVHACAPLIEPLMSSLQANVWLPGDDWLTPRIQLLLLEKPHVNNHIAALRGPTFVL